MNFETLSSVFPIIVFQMFSNLSNIFNGRVTFDVPPPLSERRSEFPTLQHPRQNDALYSHVKREKHLYSRLRALFSRVDSSVNSYESRLKDSASISTIRSCRSTRPIHFTPSGDQIKVLASFFSGGCAGRQLPLSQLPGSSGRKP